MSLLGRFSPTLRGWTPSWLLLLAACGLLLVSVDSVLLEFTQHPFTAGMAAPYSLRTPGRIGAYVSLAWILDVVVIAGAWLITLPLLRRTSLGPAQKWILLVCAGTAGPLLFSFVRYRVQLLLGPRLDIDLLLALADGSPLEMWAQSKGHLLPLLISSAVAILAFAVGIALLRWVKRWVRFEPPGQAAVAWLALGAAGASLAGLAAVCGTGGGLCTAALDKPSGMLAAATVRLTTDFDRDGFGWLSRPADPAAFDAAVYPFALEIPGNGRDENGLGGDLPLNFPGPPIPPSTPAHFARRPHVLLIFLESFRADLLERDFQGRPITPFMNRLAREGGTSRHAHSNVPATIPSRDQLFRGRLASRPGQHTLLHDFRQNGYFIAYFSGQDESFGGWDWAQEMRDFGVVDLFYDAQEDSDESYYFANSSRSLALTWKWLNSKVRGFLQTYAEDQPLFLYVNYHDTHYPYHHDDMDNILGIEPLPRHRIRPETADALWATYANGAANVDRAIERLVGDFRKAIGDQRHVILITSDHGESLFENGTLGHGMRLSDVETRVPLVVWGVGGDWPEPIGISELRGRLVAALSSPEEEDGISGPGPHPRPRPNWQPDPERRVLAYMPDLFKPSLLALRGLDGALHYDMKTDRWEARAPDGTVRSLPRERQRVLADELVHRWEAAAIQLQRGVSTNGRQE